MIFKSNCTRCKYFSTSGTFKMDNRRTPVREYNYCHYEKWLSHPEKYFDILMETIPFSQGQVKIYGQICNERRQTSMHVLNIHKGKKYSYSGTKKSKSIYQTNEKDRETHRE